MKLGPDGTATFKVEVSCDTGPLAGKLSGRADVTVSNH